jgi:hypothetical protein
LPLLNGLVNGSITADDHARLESLLVENAEARRLYSQYLDVDFGLRQLEMSESQPNSVDELIRHAAPKRGSINGRSVLLGAAIAVAACVLIAAFSYPIWWPTESLPPGDTLANNAPQPVARLVEGHGAQFRNGAQPDGDRLEPGMYDLQSGEIGLRFRNDVELTVQSPARFEIVDPMRVVAHLGRMRAHVPESGKGFTIATPGMDIEDQGTEFGVVVGADKTTELHVFSGKVKLKRPQERPEVLEEGVAGIWSDGHHTETRDVADDAFLTTPQIGFRRWEDVSRRLREDPSVVLFYDFNAESEGDVLKNRAATGATVNGDVVGCLQVTGRWPDKDALLFEKPGDQVRLNIPGQFDSYTLSVWLQANRFETPKHAILNTRGFEQGQHHLQIDRGGTLRAGLSGAYHLSSAKKTIRTGVWHHVVAVVDRNNGSANCFIDGEIVASTKWDHDTPLFFGPSVIGGFTRLSGEDGGRDFRGRMDELVLFNRALDESEVLELFEAGNGF